MPWDLRDKMAGSIWGPKTSWLASREGTCGTRLPGTARSSKRGPENVVYPFHDGLPICVFVCVSPLCLTHSSGPSWPSSRHVYRSSPFRLPIYGSRFNRLQAMIPPCVSCLLDPADCCTPCWTIAACQERGISASIPSASSPTRHRQCDSLSCPRMLSSPPQG
jgi:hypothetical protein